MVKYSQISEFTEVSTMAPRPRPLNNKQPWKRPVSAVKIILLKGG